MLLHTYAAILRRRWWIPAALVILTLLVTLVMQRPWQARPPAYALGMSLSVGIKPETPGDAYTYDGYYTALSSEYLVDDFSEIVRGTEFAAEVSRRLADQGFAIAPGAIQGSAQTGKLHRILQLTFFGSDPAQLNAIADATLTTLQEEPEMFMPRLLADSGEVALISRGQPAPQGPSLRQRLDLPLRLLLALIAGVLFVFLLEYVDTRVRERGHLETLDIPVLAEIPRQ